MEEIKAIAVIGVGEMAKGIAQHAALAEYEVRVFDIREESVTAASKEITYCFEQVVVNGVTKALADNAQKRLKYTSDIHDLETADVIIEATRKSEDKRRNLFTLLDRIAKASAILVTNSSASSITCISSATKRPRQVIGMHFMDPFTVMEVVEIVRGPDTSDETFSIIKAMSKRLALAETQMANLYSFQKDVICSQDQPGYIVNRILMPMINEAFFALHTGVATKEDIDTGMKLAGNQSMGPLEYADVLGLDFCLSLMNALHTGLGGSKYQPCPLLVQYVKEGRLGRKRGIGVYTYGKKHETTKSSP